MQYIFMALFVAGAVAADQLSKLWVIAEIPVGTQVEVVPGLFHLTHVHNTGAAWSSFQGMLWLFVLIFAVFTAAIIWEFSKKRWPFTMLERWLIVVIFSGGLGNMLDRLRLGYVVDMLEVEFIRFPVFNLADCLISCGCIALMVHLFFFNKAFWKETKK